MDLILHFVGVFWDVLNDLYFFFFSPLGDIVALVSSRLLANPDSVAGSILDKVFPKLFSLIPFLAETTIAGFILGTGLIFILLWRLAVFLLDIIN